MKYLNLHYWTKILAFLFSVTAISLSQAIIIKDDQGRIVTFENPPQKVISLAPSFTKALFLLGVGDRIVGVTIYCKDHVKVQSLPKVGTVMSFDIEKVLSLKPDLIVATPLANRVQLDKLEALGIKVLVFKSPDSFRELCEQFVKLGTLFSLDQKALYIVKLAQKELEAIKKGAKRSPRVFVQLGTDPIWAAGKDSFIGEAVSLAGGLVPIPGRGGPVEREEVLKINPDVILIVNMGIVGERERRRWKAFTSLKAVRENRIFLIDPDLYCSPTPLSFVQGVKELYRLLQSP